MAVPAGIEHLFANLRPRSVASLEMGIRSKQIDGVPCTLVVQIASSSDKPAEVFLSTAPSSLVAELWKFAG